MFRDTWSFIIRFVNLRSAVACAIGFLIIFKGLTASRAGYELGAPALPAMGVIGLCIVAVLCALAGVFILLRKG